MYRDKVRVRMEMKPEAFEGILAEFDQMPLMEDRAAVKAEFEHLRQQATQGCAALQSQASDLIDGAPMLALQQNYERIATSQDTVSQKTTKVITEMQTLFERLHDQQAAALTCPIDELKELRTYADQRYSEIFVGLRAAIQTEMTAMTAQGLVVTEAMLMRKCRGAIESAQGKVAELRNQLEYGPIPTPPGAEPLKSLHELFEGEAYPLSMQMTTVINEKLDELESSFGGHVKSLLESHQAGLDAPTIAAQCQLFDAQIREAIVNKAFHLDYNQHYFEAGKKQYMNEVKEHFNNALQENKIRIASLLAKETMEGRRQVAVLYEDCLQDAYKKADDSLQRQLTYRQKQFDQIESPDLKEMRNATWEQFLQKKVAAPEAKRKAFDEKYGVPMRDMWGITRKLYRWRRGIASALNLDPSSAEAGLTLSSDDVKSKVDLSDGKARKIGKNVELRREGDNLILEAAYPHTAEQHNVTMWNPFRPIKTARAAASDPTQLFAFSPLSLPGLAYRLFHPILQKYRKGRDERETIKTFKEIESSMAPFAAKAKAEGVPVHVSSTNPVHAASLVSALREENVDVEFMVDAQDMKAVVDRARVSAKHDKRPVHEASRGYTQARKRANRDDADDDAPRRVNINPQPGGR